MKDIPKCLFVLCLTFVLLNWTQAQSLEAKELRQNGELQKAIAAYKKVFYEKPDVSDNTYDLACAFALTFQIDSAFQYLELALKKDSSLWALADTDLFALINDERWKQVENEQLRKYQEANGAFKHPEYVKKLVNMILKDQSLDYYVDQAKSQYMKQGTIPHWYYPIAAYKQQIGKTNFEQMLGLIEKYGWPKYSSVGKLAADAPLLIINHHESEEVRKQFLPQIKKACLEKEGSCMEYAKIHDRILVNENKPQVYGMQFRFNAQNQLEPFPIQDPEYVDERRKAIGLEPLQVYLKRKINYDWVIEQKVKE